ncbi:hypothetical protein BT69DRAFT_1341510 [Atractiella rhizophila]|nr:hypothetical protein BT69DRAFT_1341510 [Atractiella rhizophila]
MANISEVFLREGLGSEVAAKGDLPFVVEVEKADHIASLLRLKKEFPSLKLVLSGATEAHLVADELAEAGVAVAITRPRCYPGAWDTRRCLDGPPLSPDSLPVYLATRNVTIALGAGGAWQTRHLFWEAAQVYLNSNGRISKSEALDWVSSNVEEIFGVHATSRQTFEVGSEIKEFVAFEGDAFDFGSRVVAIADGAKGIRLI